MKEDHKNIDPELLQYVIDCMPQNELLCQLAEEASELSQAALKLRRAYDRTNPTPVSKEDALKHLYEEIADVWLTLKALGLDTEPLLPITTDGWQKRSADGQKDWMERCSRNED